MNARKCRQCGRVFQPKNSRNWYCSKDCLGTHRKDYMQHYMRSYRLQSGLALGSLNFNDLHVTVVNGQERIKSAVLLERYVDYQAKVRKTK